MEDAPFVLEDVGLDFVCGVYRENGCPPREADNDSNYCTRPEPATGAPWLTPEPLDLWGNGCPSQSLFSVLAPVQGGAGTHVYEKIGTGTRVEYAQVVKDAFGGGVELPPGRERSHHRGPHAARHRRPGPGERMPDLACCAFS